MMSIVDFLHLVEILVWPVVVLVAIIVIRPHLSNLISGAKLKLTIAGLVIETTLPELKQILEEQIGEPLSPEQIEYLLERFRDGPKQYPSGVEASSTESSFGHFVMPALLTVPRNAFLRDATAIEISTLGRLYLRARETTP